MVHGQNVNLEETLNGAWTECELRGDAEWSMEGQNVNLEETLNGPWTECELRGDAEWSMDRM